MNNEQPKAVGAGTSVNKEYLKSKAASNSCCILLERDQSLRLATNSCSRSRASQTDGYRVLRYLKPSPRETKEDGHIGRHAGGPVTVVACDPILHGNKTV